MADDLDLTIGAPSDQRAEGAVLRQIALDGDRADDLGDGAGGEPPMVDEWMVRGVVRSVVEGTLGLFLAAPELSDVPGVPETDLKTARELWDFTDRELDELVPPLTRIINRRPALRAAVIRGDEAVVAVVMARYLGRNFADRRRLTRHVRDDERPGEVPGGPGPAGRAAPGPVGPDQPGGAGGHGVHPAPR